MQHTQAVAARTIEHLPKLGVGLLYNPSLPEYLQDHLDSYDYVSVIPDMFWTDAGADDPRFRELRSWMAMLEWMRARKPLIAHNIGMSLGSAGNFDHAYVEHLGGWHDRFAFPWHSDHLSFIRITDTAGHDHNAGMAVPVPYDADVLDIVTERVEYVLRTIPRPFLVENNVYFVDIPEQEMTEPQFLNRLAARTGCGLLLDLHNVYANARNHGFEATEFIGALTLESVVEIHIAGGSELGDMYTDSHAGPCPEPVWELLEWTVPRVPNLCGITFEFHDSYYPLLKAPGITAELERAHQIWDACR